MQDEVEWQSEARRCGVVLHEVFAWLGGAELARAGAACRAWRRAAAARALWRRLLLPADTDPDGGLSWRQEYVAAHAGWAPAERHRAAGGAVLLAGALAPAHDALALGADDASLSVWRRAAGAPAWRPRWRLGLRARGWAAVRAVSWARAAPRLLLAGDRLLAHDWELLVLQLDDDYGGGRVAARALGAAGAAGCWLGAGAFVSLELRLLAPGLACTTVWLNAATQETQSEYAGVTTPLLRIFNEDGAHITHALVVEAEAEAEGGCALLVAGWARGLSAWRVARGGPPALLAGAPGELAARAHAHRARRARSPPPPPDEASVRAACAPPALECRLPALVGLALHDSGRWLVAACADGGVRQVCARRLRELRAWWPAPAPPAPLAPLARPAPAHYAQPAAAGRYVASPAGAYSSRVHTWALRAGAVCAVEARGEGEGGAACVCALLARGGGARAQLLALAGDTLHVWRSRATRQREL